MKATPLAQLLIASVDVPLRLVSKPLPAIKKNGSRIRGVALFPNLALGRDKKLYYMSSSTSAFELPDERILEVFSKDQLLAAYLQVARTLLHTSKIERERERQQRRYRRAS